jgi:predicted enzyme related to lactoylglutathione lyase
VTERGEPEVAYVMFDCRDEERVAAFWQALLGLGPQGRRGPYVFARAADGLGLGFQRVDTAKAGKNRVHLDLRVDRVADAQDRVHALGGGEVRGYDEGGFVVMADPEGNEFCLIPRDGAGLDESGHAHYAG